MSQTDTTTVKYARLPLERPAHAPLWARRVSLFGFVIMGIVLALVGATVLSIDPIQPDFEYFYKGGLSVYQNQTLDPGYDVLADGTIQHRDSLRWYLPFVSRVMSLIAWMPHKVAGALCLLINLTALFTTIRLIARNMMGLPKRDWMVVQILPFLLCFGAWYWEFRLNQIDSLTLLLLVASFVHWQRGWKGRAGVWLGFAVLFKVTPMLIVVWFLLKREWRTAGLAVATIFLMGPVGDVMFFGVDKTVQYYQDWRQAVESGAHHMLIVNEISDPDNPQPCALHAENRDGKVCRHANMDWRNEGMGAVMCRLLHRTDYSLYWGDDSRFEGKRKPKPPKFVNIVDLPAETVARIHSVFSGLLGLGLIVLAFRPARKMTTWQLRFEWALFVLAMLWFMPVMRRYHVILVFPTLSMLAAGLHYVNHRGWWGRLAQISLFLLLAVLGTLLSGVRWPEGVGLILWATLIIGVPMIAMVVWLRRNPDALPPDPYTEN